MYISFIGTSTHQSTKKKKKKKKKKKAKFLQKRITRSQARAEGSQLEVGNQLQMATATEITELRQVVKK